MPTQHHAIALEWKAKHVLCSPLVKAAQPREQAARGKGEAGTSRKPGDKWLWAGVAVPQCEFCRGWAVLVMAGTSCHGLPGLGWQWD